MASLGKLTVAWISGFSQANLSKITHWGPLGVI